jgi:hypothetical protein
MLTRKRSLTRVLPLSMLFSCGVLMLLLVPRADAQDKAPRPKIGILVFDNISSNQAPARHRSSPAVLLSARRRA